MCMHIYINTKMLEIRTKKLPTPFNIHCTVNDFTFWKWNKFMIFSNIINFESQIFFIDFFGLNIFYWINQGGWEKVPTTYLCLSLNSFLPVPSLHSSHMLLFHQDPASLFLSLKNGGLSWISQNNLLKQGLITYQHY